MSYGIDGCPEQDSNLHTSRHSHLKRARLPFRHLGINFKADIQSRLKLLQLLGSVSINCLSCDSCNCSVILPSIARLCFYRDWRSLTTLGLLRCKGSRFFSIYQIFRAIFFELFHISMNISYLDNRAKTTFALSFPRHQTLKHLRQASTCQRNSNQRSDETSVTDMLERSEIICVPRLFIIYGICKKTMNFLKRSAVTYCGSHTAAEVRSISIDKGLRRQPFHAVALSVVLTVSGLRRVFIFCGRFMTPLPPDFCDCHPARRRRSVAG